MQFDISYAIEVLERTPASFHALLAGLSEKWTTVNEGNGTWNAAEVLAHLIYLDRNNWLHRAKLVLATAEVVCFDPLKQDGRKKLKR